MGCGKRRLEKRFGRGVAKTGWGVGDRDGRAADGGQKLYVGEEDGGRGTAAAEWIAGKRLEGLVSYGVVSEEVGVGRRGDKRFIQKTGAGELVGNGWIAVVGKLAGVEENRCSTTTCAQYLTVNVQYKVVGTRF